MLRDVNNTCGIYVPVIQWKRKPLLSTNKLNLLTFIGNRLLFFIFYQISYTDVFADFSTDLEESHWQIPNFSSQRNPSYLQAGIYGKILEDWRKADIVPIYQKGHKNKPSNRLVSLASIACNLLEHIVHSNVMEHYD